MFKFYFFNSYHQSPVGYQLTMIQSYEPELQMVKINKCDTQELQSALFNSGAVCLIGRSTDNVDYFLLRKITVTDADGRVWYINMALESDAVSRSDYLTTVRSIVLNNEKFTQILSECFRTQDEELSYQLDGTKFWAAMHQLAEAAAADDFYMNDSPHTAKLCDALSAMDTLAAQELALIVPESTMTYFLNQNPVFRSRKIGQTISHKAFAYLLVKDPAVYTYEDEVPVQETRKKIDLTEEQQENIRKVAFGVGALLAVYGTYKLVDYLFGKDD